MKAHTTILEPVRPQATAAVVLGTAATRPTVISPEHPPQTARPAHSIPEALQKEAAKAREDVRRRYHTAFRTPWDHGGINE